MAGAATSFKHFLLPKYMRSSDMRAEPFQPDLGAIARSATLSVLLAFSLFKSALD
jgi:hypothetical protein